MRYDDDRRSDPEPGNMHWCAQRVNAVSVGLFVVHFEYVAPVDRDRDRILAPFEPARVKVLFEALA